MKKFLLAIIIFSFLLPTYAFSADYELSPEFNPLCWKLDECNASRALLLDKAPEELKGNKDGWIEDEEPCSQKGWGKCLPAGKTKTNIAFGGKRNFTDIGEFFKYNYNLALSIAGILAVIMIVIAGIQWVTSGGNSEMISSAKKRIGGALIGLLIAYLSYTILSIVNPALVNLRLPQAWMIRPSKVGPEWCRDSESASFSLAAKKGEVLDNTKMSELMKNPKFDLTDKAKFECGNKYFALGSGTQTCMGAACAVKGQSCLPLTIQGEDTIINQPNCQPGQLIVHYSISLDLLDYVFEGQPLVAKVENKDWLAWFGTKDLFTSGFTFWPVCQTKVSGKLYIGDASQQWDGGVEGRKIATLKKSPFYEYYVVFDNLNPYINPSPYSENYWDCFYEGDTVVGFVFNSVLAQNWGRDADFYVSKKHIGAWQSISANGYISIDDLKNGVLVDATVNSAVLNEILADPTSAPDKLQIDGNDKNGHIDPDVTAALKAGAGAMYKESSKGL